MRDDERLAVDEALDDAVLIALAEAHAAPPPPTLGARIQAAAAAETRARRTRGALRRWRAVGSVAASLALVLAGLALRSVRLADLRAVQQQALARRNAALTAELASQSRTLAAAEASLEAQSGVLRILAGPGPLVAALEAKRDPRAHGRVVVDPTSGATAVLLAGLGPASNGTVYELWAIRGSAAAEPAGLLSVPADGVAWTRVAAVARPGEVTAFAVSIEPSGGSRAPTGPIVLAGALRRG